MNGNFMIKIAIVIIFILSICIASNSVYAVGDIIRDGDSFVATGGDGAVSTTNLKNVSDMIYNILLGIGVVVAVAIAVVLGIQFMTGSLEEQAKVKESLIPFIIGCIIVFGAFGIWRAVVVLAQRV